VRHRLIYLNGRLVGENTLHISALDRGFTLGDGVFDTMRAVGGRVFRLEDHLSRLECAARTIGIQMPVESPELVRAISTVLEANRLADALVRVTLSRGVPAERGLLPPASPSPSLIVIATAFTEYPREWYEKGYRTVTSQIRRNASSPLSRIKSCNYLDSVLARMEASVLGAEEAILINTSGDLACGASSNVFLVRGGTLVTPSLESGILDGITRRTVLELAAQLGFAHSQRPVRPEEMDLAQEIFVTNTAVGIMPVVAIDGRPVGRGSTDPSLSALLREAYSELLTHID